MATEETSHTSQAAAREQTAAREDARRKTRDILGLALLGLSTRLAWVFWGAWTSGDVADYVALARNIAFNHIFSLSPEGAAPLVPTAYRPPLYPTLIAAFWWGDALPATAVLILQALLGTGTVVLVYLIARDRFNRTVALIAGVGMALGTLSGYWTATLMTETLFTFLLTLGFFLWGRKHHLWAGVVFGLSMLTRPTLTPFLLLLLLLPLLPAWRRQWRTHAMIVLMALAVTSIWVIRNGVVFRRFILVASSGYGTNLLFGTLETKLTGDDNWSTVLKDPAIQVEPGLAEDEADRARLRKAVGRIVADPLRWLKVRAKQYPRFFMDSGDYLLGSYNIPIGQAISERRFLVVFFKVAFILGNLLFWALAAFGLFTERKRFVQLEHITLFPVFLTLIHLPMWIEVRYSLPMVPLASILAAVGLLRLVEMLRGRKKERAAAVLQ